MLILSMNTKRQRRPNVRLGEIGDTSAAFACGFSQVTTTKEKLGHKRWKNDFGNPSERGQNLICGFSEKDSELTISDPGVSPRNSADSQQNRENKNPNSLRAVEFMRLDRTGMVKSTLDFGNITRKCRGMSDCETPATSKEAYECDAYGSNHDLHRKGDFGDYWNEDTCFEENEATKCGGVWDEIKSEGGDTNCVRTWLEEMGFGKYADAFEMHEVDEEALLLLTLEDLKEMGVFAVGPRRKLYNAIQQLRGGDLSA
ncbi:Protein bicaudal C-1-B-like protein [Morus notabilis]|uniref:Protein bicaudal C-1-B-like protein n=1 Tax=Morus notabilis TaxID=981085 RepID=W9S528_9ROSA|nr:Protein bicaudal C-1-B-like protein [Morus notabilis]